MKKGLIPRILLISLVSFTAGTLAVGTIAWFTTMNATSEETIDGEIGLRSYFFAGNGTESEPYEIVSPTHLYNLSRLQDIGIFPEKCYFQVGHVFEGYEKPQCISEYIDGDPVYSEYLDMHDTVIRPIGSEATPFVGTFKGNGIPIRNLKVAGYPEDIGVFGYVAHEGIIDGLICEDLEVKSLGYSNSSSDPTYKLFNPEIDDIFDENAHYFATDTSLSYFKYNGAAYSETVLKRDNGLNGVVYAQVNGTDSLVEDSETIMNGYFVPTYPQVANDPFKYSWRSSSGLVVERTAVDIDNDGNLDKAIMIDLASLRDSTNETNGFNTPANADKNMCISSRLSLYATLEMNGYVYSRVIQSYTLKFYSNMSIYDEGKYSLQILCDYVAPETPGHIVTNYAHGCNIGFLVGHLDGSLMNSYVYKGNLIINNENDYHPIATESDLGLIGEVGANVLNTLDPDYGQVTNGDIGVMNFTQIYNGIRGNMSAGQVVKAGHINSPESNFVCYDNYINTGDDSLFDLYEPYLRYTPTATKHYITDAGVNIPKGSVIDPDDNEWTWHNHTVPETVPNKYNSVDFLWNNVIKDEDDEDRGLGVFKIVSTYNQSAKNNPGDYGTYAYSNIGSCAIVEGPSESKIYYSTAEYNHQIDDPDNAWPDHEPLRGTSIPSYSDILSFGYPFSRDYNYCFELDLTQADTLAGWNYMSNTNSEFLDKYFSSILIDRFGASIETGNPRHGFMFRSSKNEILTSLSSYMPLGKPGDKANYGTAQNPVYYPSNSIVFKIENENGANVSVVGNNEDISIYSFDSSTSGGGVTKMLTMRSKNRNDTIDYHRYFTYDAATGETGTEAVPFDNNMYDINGKDKALYAHVFKLPMGEYVIGSAKSDAKANLYFLAVQGQTEAEIGTSTPADLGNKVEKVDFLIEQPTVAQFPNSYVKGELDFNLETNSNSGTFTVDVITVSGDNYMSLEFEDAPYFVTYLSADSKATHPKFYINSEVFERSHVVYRQNI